MNCLLKSWRQPAPVLILVLSASFAGQVRAESPSVSESSSEGAFPLVSDHAAAEVLVDENEPPVVSIAVDAFADDIERVTGRKGSVRHADDPKDTEQSAVVYVGTVGQSRLIDCLIAAGKVDVTPIKDRWEAFLLAVVTDPTPNVKQALVIVGSDRRGTAYGLMTLSEAIGVSPWYWWADVPPEKRSALYVSVPTPTHDAPAVKYRGFFINDEDWGLTPWTRHTFDPKFGNIGPKTYEKVFELMLRLRLNYLWPAMHGGTTEFASAPENVALADRYGIVAGSSHCEPMLCNNVHWNTKERGPWNYSTNRDALYDYWVDMVRARQNTEAVWTLGIRGIHDGPMQSPPNDMPGKIQLLTEVFRDQQALLDEYVTEKWGPVARCFVPYKEVLGIYDAGLPVPDDVTLVWVDDNFGYIRRLGGPEERKRSGGGGVYYHLSYFGGPHSYTWINTTAPALMWEELHKAWENDARTIWVINVGDIKPMEVGIDYFSRLAWDAKSFGPDSQPRFLRDFAARTFGEVGSQQVADLLADYYRLGTIRKPELMNRGWAVSLPPDRAAELGRDYERLLSQEATIAAEIPVDAQDAFTEMVGFPARVLGSAGLIFLADRKIQQGEDVTANEQEISHLRADLEDRVKTFNTTLAGGKWEYMMPGLATNRDLTSWSSQVRWPWGETLSGTVSPSQPRSRPDRSWRDAATADRHVGQGPAQWVVVDGLGTSGRAVALEPADLALEWNEGDQEAPGLEFDFTAPNGESEVRIDFLPTFRIARGMKLRVAVSVDDQPATTVEVPGSSGAEDESGSVRALAVQNNHARARVPLPNLTAGKHVLIIRAVDPGAVIDRVSVP